MDSASLEALLDSHRAAGHESLAVRDLDRFRAIADRLPPTPASVLDAGCGIGVLTDWLTELGYAATGADIDEALMAAIRAPHVTASVDALPFEDGTFETVVASEVLEHLPVTVYDRARAEIARVARASIVVTVPNGEPLEATSTRCPHCLCTYSPDGHVRRFERDDMVSLLPGWRLNSIDQVGPWKVRHRSVGWYLHRRLLGHWPRGPGSVCPQCGYRQPGNQAGATVGSFGRLRRLFTAAAAFPWRDRYHLIAHYLPDADPTS